MDEVGRLDERAVRITRWCSGRQQGEQGPGVAWLAGDEGGRSPARVGTLEELPLLLPQRGISGLPGKHG